MIDHGAEQPSAAGPSPESILRDESERQRDTYLLGLWTPPPGVGLAQALTRSVRWRRVREEHLARHGVCLCCGNTRSLEVHHLLPFHLFADREEDPDNLVTLCSQGPAGMNCHLLVGHGGNWRDYNPDAVRDAAYVLSMISSRKLG